VTADHAVSNGCGGAIRLDSISADARLRGSSETNWRIRSTGNACRRHRAGKAILEIAQRMLKDVENLRQVGEEFTEEDNGHLTIRNHAHPGALRAAHVIQRFPSAIPGCA